MLAQEAYASLVLGIVLLVLERLLPAASGCSRQSIQHRHGAALGAVLLHRGGYFALQPMMAAPAPGRALELRQLHR